MSDIDSALAALDDQPMADSSSKPAKAPKLSANLKKLLPAQPPVVEVNGVASFVDQASGKLIASRLGVPCFDKQGALKAMHGSFGDARGASAWLDGARSDQRITEKEKQDAEELLALAHRSDRLTNYVAQKASDAARPKVRSTSPSPARPKSSGGGGKYKGVALNPDGSEVELTDAYGSVGAFVDQCCALAPESNLHRFEVVLHSASGHAAVKRLPHAGKALQKLFVKRMQAGDITLDDKAEPKNEPWILLFRGAKQGKAKQEQKPAVTAKPEKKRKVKTAEEGEKPAKKPKKEKKDKVVQQGSTPLIIQPVVLQQAKQQQQQQASKPPVKLTMAAVAAMAAQSVAKKQKQ